MTVDSDIFRILENRSNLIENHMFSAIVVKKDNAFNNQTPFYTNQREDAFLPLGKWLVTHACPTLRLVSMRRKLQFDPIAPL